MPNRMNRRPRVECVIFDFDYTLADSSDGVIDCVNYALNRLGLPTAKDDAIRRTIGLSLPHTLVALAGERHADLGDEFMRLFIERADVILHDSIVMFDFVASTVDVLRNNGLYWESCHRNTGGVSSACYGETVWTVASRS